MDPGLKARWIEALLSGRYAQAKNYLRTTEGYCCLGVLCDLLPNGEWDERPHEIYRGTGPSPVVYQYHASMGASDLAIPNGTEGVGTLGDIEDSASQQYHLSAMNDGGESFAKIAEWIRVNV